MTHPMPKDRTEGPYIVWQNFGYEGWKPNSFETLEEANAFKGYGEQLLLTKRVKVKVVEDDGFDYYD